MRISDWSSDVCSSDLSVGLGLVRKSGAEQGANRRARRIGQAMGEGDVRCQRHQSNKLDTLVSSAMRLIASPSSGATVRARTLALSWTASVGWSESVMTSSVSSLASDRKSVGEGRRGSVRVGLWSRRIFKKKKKE